MEKNIEKKVRAVLKVHTWQTKTGAKGLSTVRLSHTKSMEAIHTAGSLEWRDWVRE